MKIVIIGGHLTPALAVIDELKKTDEIIYVGRKNALEGDDSLSLEYKVINERKIEFVELRTGRLQRSFTKHTIPSLAKIPFGLYQSIGILKKFKPNVVVGFGGYVSMPIVVAAKFLGIPILIHEQTLSAGFANQKLAKIADKVCISFDSSIGFFPKEKTVLTGNPIRKSITSPVKKFDISSKYPIIYITGGSLGSHFINSLISKTLNQLLSKYTIVHQTGSSSEFSDYNNLFEMKNNLDKDLKEKYIVSEFFSPEEIGSIMKASTFIISRAGINSVSEIIYLEKPSILIPLSVSQKNEQLKNANFVKDLGLGVVLEQEGLDPEEFLFQINKFFNNIEEYKINDSRDHFPKNAARKIIEQIYEIQQNSN